MRKAPNLEARGLSQNSNRQEKQIAVGLSQVLMGCASPGRLTARPGPLNGPRPRLHTPLAPDRGVCGVSSFRRRLLIPWGRLVDQPWRRQSIGWVNRMLWVQRLELVAYYAVNPLLWCRCCANVNVGLGTV